MADAPDNRLTDMSPDNHQPWLWFSHIFFFVCVISAGGLRFWIKRKYYGTSDIVLGVAHLFYISYWITLLFALINGLGKSDLLDGPARETKASKLLFASRILLVLLINLAKLATMFLVQEIFTKGSTKWWLRAFIVLTVCESFIGSLLISVGCSPGRVLLAGDKAHCPGLSARWIVFTTFEAILEPILIIPVIIIVSNLQTNFQNKMFAISVFLCRIFLWIPAFVHLSSYLGFIHHGRNNIDIVVTVAMEELWITLALVSASIPALMRLAKRFITSGVTVGTTYASSRGGGGSRTKEFSHKLATSDKTRFTPTTSRVDPSGDIVLRPDEGFGTVNVEATKATGEGASISSNAESHIGILRQVEFDVSYEAKRQVAFQNVE